jgi:hypothetical protein
VPLQRRLPPHLRTPPPPDPPLTARPLPHVPGYCFPTKLTAELRADSPRVWCLIEVDLDFRAGDDWPQLRELRQRPKPDWIRDRDTNVIGWRPDSVGENISLPLKGTILPLVIASGAVPQKRQLLSEIGQHTDAVLPQIKRGQRRKWTEARLTEAASHYSDALADPELNAAERLDYVARVLRLEHADTLRPIIKKLDAAGRIHHPTHQLPVTTRRIRYRIRPDSDANHISLGADPVTRIDAGHDYEETRWQLIRQLARTPEIEFDVLEKTARYW